ncbi:NACHT domain-containing protein [Streptomyces sp. Qhu-G9]|uniref:NACHT domain-containing protein n=1 Tax=Streptomyces sp. Qhu-G9 TaxID=3452799 RepID=UPI0022ABD4D9|nr:NACHT domain-containing protein [Streptomyces aurantiacus]WAU80698.1 NACHT domain-containing protein [Streptomyces aurantiacus]
MSGVAPRSRVRRAGAVYLTLLAAGTVGALLVAPHLDDPASVVAALLPTGAGAYLAWSTYRADRTEAATAADPGTVADRLAVAVRRQWETEAQIRRLEDPYPLPVAWRAADADLAEATRPGGLDGRDGELGDLFTERIPTRRLLVLGAPGSGKTLLLVRLVLSLIERRRPGGPVPVLFPLASWDPGAQDLRGWMERKLAQDHPELGAAASEEDGPVTRAAALLDRRLVLPVLDGFDELPAAVGATALHAVNEALPYGCGLVLSSRPDEYRAALRPRSGVPPRLTGMAGIRLEPLRGPDVEAYLLRDAGGSGTPAAARWRPVVDALGTDAPVAEALTRPLMVSLARSVYNPRPAEGHEELPDPGELLRCSTRAAVEHHLFEAFVGAAYRPHPRRPCRWTPARAHAALRHLARHMERGLDGAAEVAWWKLHRAVPTALPPVLVGALLGCLGWLVEGMAMELTHRAAPNPLFPPHWEERGGLGVVAAGLCGGLMCGLVAAVVITLLCAGVAPDLSAGLVLNRLADGGSLALVGVIVAGFAFGGRPEPRRPSRWDRRALLTGAAAAALYVLAFRNACGTVSALLHGVIAAAVGADGVRADPACPVARVRWHWSPRGILTGLVGGALIGGGILLEGLFADVLSGGASREYLGPAEPMEAFWAAEQVAAVYAVSCMLVQGLRTVPVDLGTSVDGRILLGNDRRTLGTCVFTAAVLGAAVIGTQGWCAMLWGSARVWGAGAGGSGLWVYVVGLVPALLTGLAIGIRQAAWSHYAVARCHLALRAKLPFDLLAFLADAHEHHGVLRRVGAVYQFRHIELQHHLAGPPRGFTASSAATAPRSRCAPSPTNGPPPRPGRAGR